MILISGTLALAAALIAGALLWSLAVHVLPLWCGGLAAVSVHAAGGGIFVSLMAGLTAATATLVIGRLLIGCARSPQLRIGVGLAFAAPAAIAGYYAALGLSATSGIEGIARVIVAATAALFTAAGAYRGALRPRSQSRPTAPEGA
jgi:hypothetical protein